VLLVTDEQYAAVKAVFVQQCKSKPLVGVCIGLVSNGTTLFYGTCYSLTSAQMSAFPNMDVVLSDTLTITMQPKDYLLDRYDNGARCLGILPTGSVFAGGLFIVGDTFMENYYTVFDCTNGQIGFAPVNAQNCGSA